MLSGSRSWAPALMLMAILLPGRSALAQVRLSGEQLAPAKLVPADVVERWYGDRDKPGDRRVRVEMRMYNNDSGAPGTADGGSYQNGEIFGNRTMQVLPIKITIDVVLPDKGVMPAEVDLTALSRGQLSLQKVERPMFKVVRPEVLAPGEAAVSFSRERLVKFTWGKHTYVAWRREVLVHVQARVRPEAGNPLPKPHPFTFVFGYATGLRPDGVKDWQVAESPAFGITTNWTADSGPNASIGHVEPVPQSPRLVVGVPLLCIGLLFVLWAWGEPLINVLRRRNRRRKLDPDEAFWAVVEPIFAACAIQDGKGYNLSDAGGDVTRLVRAIKSFADAKGCGRDANLVVSRMTIDTLANQRHNLVCGEELYHLLLRLEQHMLREQRILAPAMAARLYADLVALVGKL